MESIEEYHSCMASCIGLSVSPGGQAMAKGGLQLGKRFKKEMGERVALVRTNRGLSVIKLAELSGLSTKFIYDIEAGEKGITAHKLRGLTKALNISSDYLITGKKQSEIPEIEEIIMMLTRLSAEEIIYVKTSVQAFVRYAEKSGRK